MRVLFLLFLLFLGESLLAQCYPFPEFQSRNNQTVEIEKITVNEQYTIVEMVIKNEIKHSYRMAFDVICMMPHTYLKDKETGVKYRMIKTEKIPNCPAERYLESGEIHRFKLYFPAISKRTQILDLIEPHAESGFDFFNIKLIPMA